MSLEELYSILELPPGASLDEVKRAYRDLAQVWHPDRFTGKPHLQDRAVRNMAEINAAYRELVRHLRASERAGADSSHSRRSPASAASAGSRKRDGRAGEAPASAGVRARHAPGDQPARSRVGDETASQGDAKDEVRAAGAAPASSEVPEASALLRRRRFLQALAGAWLLGALLALGGAFRSAAPAPPRCARSPVYPNPP